MKDLTDSSSEQWQELWSLTAQLQAAEPTELVKFQGGEQREDGFFVMPWASYDATVHRIEELLYDLNVVQDVDWSGWQNAIDPDLLFDAERIKSGTLYDTVCLLTGIIRSERFGSDAIATSLLITKRSDANKNLVKGTTYQVRVRAVNSVGSGVASTLRTIKAR